MNLRAWLHGAVSLIAPIGSLGLGGCARLGEPVQTESRGETVAEVVTREARLVVDSPHFDQPVEGHGGLSCPAAPAHCFGFEGPRSDGPTATMSVRVARYRGRDGEYPMASTLLEDVQIGLAPYQGRELGDPFATDFTHRALADSEGHAEFSVEPGYYWMFVDQLGFRSGTALLHARPGARDSLRVELDVQAIC